MEEKKLTGNDLMVSLGSEDFRRYFRRNILPHLQPLEDLRVSLQKKKKFFIAAGFTVAGVLSAITAAIFPDLFWGSGDSKGLAGAIISIPIFVWVFASAWAKKKLKGLAGARIIPTLFSYWGTFKYCSTPNYNEGGARHLMEMLKVYPRYDDIEIDDCIKGEYNGLELEITELDISYEVGSGKNRRTVRVFDGLMLEVDMNKSFTSHTVIRSDRAAKISGNGFQRVNLEDPEFEKIFDVYSTDQVESRYLLTTSFMQRLLELRSTAGNRLEAAFLDKKAYFFVNYGADKFELPLDKPVTDMRHYQNILLDLARILKVVDALKLEQKIGL